MSTQPLNPEDVARRLGEQAAVASQYPAVSPGSPETVAPEKTGGAA